MQRDCVEYSEPLSPVESTSNEQKTNMLLATGHHSSYSISAAEMKRGRARVLHPRSASFAGSQPLDGFSLNRLQFASLGLYGREKEMSLLWEAYNKVKATGTKGLVMLSGYTGVGKSAIVKRFQNQLQTDRTSRGRCFVASGKFDLHHRAEPYTALIAAFKQLGDSILSLKDLDVNEFIRIRDSIREAIGSEGEVLSSVIPNIGEILGTNQLESSPSSDCDESSRGRKRFNFILRHFVRSVCSQDQPFVLFLDDLQWADVASLDVVETILTDSKLSGLLLVGCYRDNEVGKDHPLAIRLAGLHRDSNPQGGDPELEISCIHVDNLDVDCVHDLVTDVLDMMDKTRTCSLAKIVHGKTHGNVFFAIQFLIALLDEGLLHYNLGSQTWNWDDEEIAGSTRVADNVVDLLQTKLLQHVSQAVVKILQLASCLGSAFEKSILALISESLLLDERMWTDSGYAGHQGGYGDLSCSIDDQLTACVQEGFLVVAKEAPLTYSFAHDQIQSAAYSLIPREKRNVFQLCIGEVLIQRLSEDELQKMLFVAVDLLNNGIDQVEKEDKQLSFARLNLQAGKKSVETFAFASASTYLTRAIELLGADRWEKHYESCLDLVNTAMNAELGKGNVEKVYQYADEVLTQTGRPIHDKVTAYCFRMECTFDQGKPVEAYKTCMNLLNQLGEPFHLPFGKLSVALEILRARKFVKKHPLSTLGDLPIMEDHAQVQLLKIMLKCGVFAYAAKAELIPVLISKALQMTIRHGICKYSPPVFTGYGFISVAVFGDFREADQFGKFGLSLADKYGTSETKSVTFATYLVSLRHWVMPLQSSRKECLKGYRISLQSGDPIRAMTCISHFCTICYVTGEPLSKLDVDLREYCHQMVEYEQKLMLRVALVTRQSVLNLMSRSKDPVILTGEAMDQEELINHCIENERIQLFDLMRVFQLQLAFLFDRYDLAAKLVHETRNVGRTNPSNIVVWRNAGFCGLTAFALARKGVNRRKWKNHALSVLNKVRKWVSSGHVNCLHTLYLLQAEMHALHGITDKAKQKYDLAISTAGRAGFRVDKAISYERAGVFFLDIGDEHWARHYLTLAHEQYVEWEAWAKADHLQEKYSALIPHEDKTHENGQSRGART